MDSITFTKNGVTKNTLTDWGMVPTYKMDPPFISGKKRTGRYDFVMRYGDIPVSMRLAEAEEMFSGTDLVTCEFSCDPGHEYTGKWHCIRKPTFGTGMSVELKYELDEFKNEKNEINSKWVWDEFDFEDGMVTTDLLKNLKANGEEEYQSLDVDEDDLRKAIGEKTVCPIFLNKSDNDLYIKVNGVEGKIGPKEEKSFKDITFDPDGDLSIFVKGDGLFDISFTRGVR